jgi:hypothetical protein
MRVLVGAAVTLSIGLISAPPASAACTITSCDNAFTGSVAAFLATPRVSGVTAQIEAMSAMDFTGQWWFYGAGGEDPQITRVVYEGGLTRTSTRSYNGKAGRITYLSRSKACSRKVSSANPNTYAADRTATWTCRARTSSDVDGPEWLRRTLPAANVPATPQSWFVDYTNEPGIGLHTARPTLGIYLALQHWLEYTTTETSLRFEDFIRREESDTTVYTVSTAGIPALPAMSSLPRK